VGSEDIVDDKAEIEDSAIKDIKKFDSHNGYFSETGKLKKGRETEKKLLRSISLSFPVDLHKTPESLLISSLL
jgi:dTDP-4-dehydrorhamnose 3,5-epimerase-like enzyme